MLEVTLRTFRALSKTIFPISSLFKTVIPERCVYLLTLNTRTAGLVLSNFKGAALHHVVQHSHSFVKKKSLIGKK